MTVKFWIDDPNELIKSADFWPMPNMDKISKYNAISRLIIVLTIGGFFISKSAQLLMTGAVTLGIIVFMYNLRDKKVYNDDLIESFKNDTHVAESSESNPLSNVQLPEIQFDPHRPAAAKSFTKKQEKEINDNTKQMVIDESFQGNNEIKDKLFRNLGDEIDFDRSMRNFYSMPNTKIPNDQGKFAEFLYGNMPSCKEGDPAACEKLSFKYTPG